MKSLPHAMRLATIAATLASSPAVAEISQSAEIRATFAGGKSEWAKTFVRFMSGAELNAATGTSSYVSADGYAAVYFGGGEIAILTIDGATFYGREFTSLCFPVIGEITGRDQSVDTWEICTKPIC